jgi:site-specific recombinase XerD
LGKGFLMVAYGHFTNYQKWLAKQNLSEHSKRAYRSRLNHFLAYIVQEDCSRDVFTDAGERDHILKQYLKQDLNASPNSVNSALAAADSFFGFLGLAKTKVKREDLPSQARPH